MLLHSSQSKESKHYVDVNICLKKKKKRCLNLSCPQSSVLPSYPPTPPTLLRSLILPLRLGWIINIPTGWQSLVICSDPVMVGYLWRITSLHVSQGHLHISSLKCPEQSPFTRRRAQDANRFLLYTQALVLSPEKKLSCGLNRFLFTIILFMEEVILGLNDIFYVLIICFRLV